MKRSDKFGPGQVPSDRDEFDTPNSALQSAAPISTGCQSQSQTDPTPTGAAPNPAAPEDRDLVLPSLKGIESSLGLIRPYLRETPLIRSEGFSQVFGADVWLKNEAFSPIGSFKLRGALTEVYRANAISRVTGVVTASTGNHGQGVAFAARLLGTAAHVFLPVEASTTKKGMIQKFGGEIHLVGHDFDAAKDASREFAKLRGYTFIDDGEGLGVMEGAGTVGLEIARALPDISAVFIPLGAGALAGGSAAALKAIQPKVEVVAVQVKGAPAMFKSFHARRPIDCPIDVSLVADGLACRKPPRLGLAAVLRFVDNVVLCDDTELLGGVHTLIEIAHVLVEPAGAAALTAAWQGREHLKGKRIVLVLSGANIGVKLLRQVLSTATLFPSSYTAAS